MSPLKIIRRSFVGSFSSFILIISSRSFFNFPKLLTALLIIFLVTFYISNQNFYRTSVGGCQEFLITETGQKLLIRELKQRQSDTNVFISLNSDIWKFQFDNRGQTKIITPNLAIFQNDEFLIYFSAFPEREKGANTSIENYKLFFTDLFDYLKSKKEFNKIKSITFFDAGFHNDYLDQIPQASFLKYAEQTLANKNLTKDDYNFWSKIHDLALSIHNTQYPMKFYSNDPSSACGRKILILSLTPDFVKNNILTIPTK